MVMATSFVTDMQTINPSPVQPVQATTQPQTVTVTVTGSQANAGNSGTKIIQTLNNAQNSANNQSQPTIIQPTQGGQQFIVTISGEPGEQQVQETVQLGQGGQVVYPSQQYVEGSDQQPALYAASNGQMQSYSEYGQNSMYTPVSGTYYQAGSGGSTVAQIGGIQGQILTHQGGTYLVQSGTMDGEGHPLTHTTRASPATQTANGPRTANFDAKCWQREGIQISGLQHGKYEVQWLIDNYETAEGVSLPRSTLYNHYLRHCQEQKMDPMNPASFGKLIRSVFLGLRTRRLGTRGNSKYHYYGIRIKATSPLNQFTDDQTMALRQQPVNPSKRYKQVGRDGTESESGTPGSESGQQNSAQHQHQQFLGDASCAIPNFGCVEFSNPLPNGITAADIRTFEQLYKEHSEAILDVVVNLQFSLIEALWQSFWRTTSDQQTNEYEQRLSKDKLYTMCKMDSVQKYVRKSDYNFYQALVEVLIPDVLRPIPSSLTQAIRNFAKTLEGWLKTATAGVPEEMSKTKLGAVSAFAQTLRRYTSLNHLAQAARAVLQNTSQINQMLTDLNRVDFANVQEQASWVCQCDDTVVQHLEQDFKKTLQQQNSLEQWAVWLEGVVNQVLKQHEGSPNFPKAARQFLLKWSFYSSMVIRDLTLRSAASFGSFHLIRLLYDEYMFYLVEHKVAAATGETPIAVMGEFADLSGAVAMGNMDSSPVNPKVEPTAKTTAASSSSSAPSTSSVKLTTTSTSGHTTTLPNGNTTTVTLLATSSGNTQSGPTKTIVVVPVSSSGSGDAQPNKKLKII